MSGAQLPGGLGMSLDALIKNHKATSPSPKGGGAAKPKTGGGASAEPATFANKKKARKTDQPQQLSARKPSSSGNAGKASSQKKQTPVLKKGGASSSKKDQIHTQKQSAGKGASKSSGKFDHHLAPKDAGVGKGRKGQVDVKVNVQVGQKGKAGAGNNTTAAAAGKQQTPGSTVQVSNLDPVAVSNQDVLELFEQIGPLKKSGLILDNLGRSRGMAEVSFKRPEDAEKAVRSYNGSRQLAGEEVEDSAAVVVVVDVAAADVAPADVAPADVVAADVAEAEDVAEVVDVAKAAATENLLQI